MTTRDYQKENQTPEARARRRRYNESEKGQAANRKGQKRYRKKYPERVAAQQAVRHSHGSATGHRCRECDKPATAKHHPDHGESPGRIEWLCHAHHVARHHDTNLTEKSVEIPPARFVALKSTTESRSKVSKDEATYISSPPKEYKRCRDCRYFDEPDACHIVIGSIAPDATCYLWTSRSGQKPKIHGKYYSVREGKVVAKSRRTEITDEIEKAGAALEEELSKQQVKPPAPPAAPRAPAPPKPPVAPKPPATPKTRTATPEGVLGHMGSVVSTIRHRGVSGVTARNVMPERIEAKPEPKPRPTPKPAPAWLRAPALLGPDPRPPPPPLVPAPPKRPVHQIEELKPVEDPKPARQRPMRRQRPTAMGVRPIEELKPLPPGKPLPRAPLRTPNPDPGPSGVTRRETAREIASRTGRSVADISHVPMKKAEDPHRAYRAHIRSLETGTSPKLRQFKHTPAIPPEPLAPTKTSLTTVAPTKTSLTTTADPVPWRAPKMEVGSRAEVPEGRTARVGPSQQVDPKLKDEPGPRFVYQREPSGEAPTYVPRPKKVEKAKESPRPPKEYREGGATRREDYADPQNYKYPIDTEQHVRAAVSYFSKPKNANVYSSSEQRSIWRRIVQAAKRYDIQLSPRAGPPSIDKGELVPMVGGVGGVVGNAGDEMSKSPGVTMHASVKNSGVGVDCPRGHKDLEPGEEVLRKKPGRKGEEAKVSKRMNKSYNQLTQGEATSGDLGNFKSDPLNVDGGSSGQEFDDESKSGMPSAQSEYSSEKWSDDDAEVEQQMSPHKKPLETSEGRKGTGEQSDLERTANQVLSHYGLKKSAMPSVHSDAAIRTHNAAVEAQRRLRYDQNGGRDLVKGMTAGKHAQTAETAATASANVWHQGQVLYTDMEDQYIAKAQNQRGEITPEPTLGVPHSPLTSAKVCMNDLCKSAMPAYLTTCPTCGVAEGVGGHLGSGHVVMEKAVAEAIRPSRRNDLYMPFGARIESETE